MSIPQTNFENNNRMSELTKNINDIFGYVLLYSVIIFTALSALFGRIVVYPIYKIIKVFNKIRETCCTKAEIEAEAETKPEKKPIIDENWCNVSVKNIIDYTNANEIEDEIEEVLSVRKPSQEELRQFQEEEESESESDDGSPRDRYSIGHYKSKTYINDPLNIE